MKIIWTEARTKAANIMFDCNLSAKHSQQLSHYLQKHIRSHDALQCVWSFAREKHISGERLCASLQKSGITNDEQAMAVLVRPFLTRPLYHFELS